MVSTRTILIYSFNVIFSIICVIGLSFQIKLVADYYFKYATVTEIMAVIPTKLYVPDLSLCIRYVDIFNMTRYTADTNITIADNLKQDYFTRVQNTVTIADIFHYTPNENEIFDSCLMRYSNSYNYERKNGARCYDEFNVTKYYIQEYLCYKFEWYTQADVEHDYRNLAYAVEFPGMFYNVNLELEPLKRANVMKLILHDTGYPYRSSSLAPPVLRQYNPASVTLALAQYGYEPHGYGHNVHVGKVYDPHGELAHHYPTGRHWGYSTDIKHPAPHYHKSPHYGW
ncbi:hypothetical protein HDE_13219 [Halotydeus destructor]|nr:hypothetical protein HDE_13219 [Halotydeus destructor]